MWTVSLAEAFIHVFQVAGKIFLDIAQCQNHEMVRFASHQLRGAALSSWENFRAMQPAGHTVTWEVFRTAFRRSHIPAGLMKLKKREFLSLKQGHRSVMEYLYEFNHLARYAPAEVASDGRQCGTPPR